MKKTTNLWNNADATVV